MQTEEWTIANITGADQLVAWFGSWPSFHDAEIIRVHFERRGISYLEIHTWEMTQAIDPNGAYVLDKHVVVTFKLQEVMVLELNGFSHQNVIYGLTVGPAESGIEITLEGCFGLGRS